MTTNTDIYVESHYDFQRNYFKLIQQIIEFGDLETGRNGDVKRLSHPQIFRMSNLVSYTPLLTTRKMNPLCWITEFCWDWNGRTKVSELGKYSYLWETWADPQTGRLPFSYGRIWRNPTNALYDETEEEVTRNNQYDQITSIVESLVKAQIDQKINRRLVLNTWDPRIIHHNNAVPPCHPMLNFQTDFGIAKTSVNLSVVARSQDMLVGFPGDVVRYHMLLNAIVLAANNECLRKGISPNFLAGSMTFIMLDCHVYQNHVEIYRGCEHGVFEDRVCAGSLTPTLSFSNPEKVFHNTFLKPDDIQISNYFPVNHPIKYGLIA